VRVPSLRHDALKAHLAGVKEDERALLVVEVLVEAQARRRPPEEARERRLAHCERVPAHVLAVKLDQVESKEEHAPIVSPIPDALERRDPIVAAGDRLAVDDARPPRSAARASTTSGKR